MRKRSRVCVWLMMVSACLPVSALDAAAHGPQERVAPGEQFVGVWSGTWEGAGSGTFELTLEKDGTGTIGGRVAVTGEPTYKANFRALSFEAEKMTAKYDFPEDERAEVLLAATFTDDRAKGTWSLRAKENDEEIASGTWTVTRKR